LWPFISKNFLTMLQYVQVVVVNTVMFLTIFNPPFLVRLIPQNYTDILFFVCNFYTA
jgi:hypothetical protein